MTTPAISAHIALGRLVQFLDDDTHSLWLSDALRREAIASMKLDSQLVHGEDVAIGQLHQTRIIRPDLRAALSVIQTAERLLGGSYEEHGIDQLTLDDRLKPKRLHALNMEELEPRGFDWNAEEEDIEPLAEGDPLTELLDDAAEAQVAQPTLPPALSSSWLTLAWSGLDTKPDASEIAALEHAASVIDEALQVAGLEGVGHAIWQLHRPGFWPEAESYGYEQIKAADKDFGERLEMAHAEALPPSPGLRLVRLITPWLIQRSCGLLARPMPFVSTGLVSSREYREIAHISKDRWTRAFCGLMSDLAEAEMRRVAELRTVMELWRRQLRDGRKTADKVIERTKLLVQHPAVSSESLSKRSGMTRRMSQHFLDIWERAGVIRRASKGYTERVWIADRVATWKA
jgi:hypothetical protein